MLDSDSQQKYRSDSQDLGLRIYMVKLLQFNCYPQSGEPFIFVHIYLAKSNGGQLANVKLKKEIIFQRFEKSLECSKIYNRPLRP